MKCKDLSTTEEIGETKTEEVRYKMQRFSFIVLLLCVCPVNTSLSVVMDTNAVLHCPRTLTRVVLTRWEIILRDKPSCTKAHRSDTNETKEINCTDDRITWASRPSQNPDLQIAPVAITHDGYYRCVMVTPDGNFNHNYHLQVLVPPEATLSLSRNRTVVCKAVAGKPAAQISWTPEGDDCVTEQEYWGNGTVTVQSTCSWEVPDVTTVTCAVSHLTGNRSLCIELLPGLTTSRYPALPLLIILYVKLSFCSNSCHRGICFFWRTSDCRNIKSAEEGRHFSGGEGGRLLVTFSTIRLQLKPKSHYLPTAYQGSVFADVARGGLISIRGNP
ncbi:cell surface glycoprotein CD200 receptor 2-like [Lemur catta]|uniref:cell surface glycoprotein CD200 receptor 2-like n=1 Tax=Lemur catta TaxID=9447 RepID=UPI001E267222|nr:cell surface glycoprotein CD200 receptor 2-like [Lemur catta]